MAGGRGRGRGIETSHFLHPFSPSPSFFHFISQDRIWPGFSFSSFIPSPFPLPTPAKYAGVSSLQKKERATHSSILAWRIPMDRGTWQAIIHGVTKSQTWLKQLSPLLCTIKNLSELKPLCSVINLNPLCSVINLIMGSRKPFSRNCLQDSSLYHSVFWSY